jgi:hypothetical protein
MCGRSSKVWRLWKVLKFGGSGCRQSSGAIMKKDVGCVGQRALGGDLQDGDSQLSVHLTFLRRKI